MSDTQAQTQAWPNDPPQFARDYVPPAPNPIASTLLLNNIEQDMAFVKAFIDRINASIAQHRSMTGQ